LRLTIDLQSRSYVQCVFKIIVHQMKNETSLPQLIAAWSAEAVSRWGDDWPKISDHITGCYKALPASEQARLADEASQTILDGALASVPGSQRH
jgi:hypothetical protein